MPGLNRERGLLRDPLVGGFTRKKPFLNIDRGLLRDPLVGGFTRKKPFIRSAHKVLNYFCPSLEQVQLGP